MAGEPNGRSYRADARSCLREGTDHARANMGLDLMEAMLLEMRTQQLGQSFIGLRLESFEIFWINS